MSPPVTVEPAPGDKGQPPRLRSPQCSLSPIQNNVRTFEPHENLWFRIGKSAGLPMAIALRWGLQTLPPDGALAEGPRPRAAPGNSQLPELGPESIPAPHRPEHGCAYGSGRDPTAAWKSGHQGARSGRTPGSLQMAALATCDQCPGPGLLLGGAASRLGRPLAEEMNRKPWGYRDSQAASIRANPQLDTII